MGEGLPATLAGRRGEEGRPLSETIDLSEETKPRGRGLIAFAAWTALAVLFGFGLWAHADLPLALALPSAIIEYYALALLAIPVWRVSRRLSERRLPTARFLAAHGLMGLCVLVAWRGAILVLQYLSLGDALWPTIYEGSWVFQLASGLVTYAAMVGLVLVVQSGDRERVRERREAALALAAREAELSALKAHLQPHFLFNTLHSVMGLVDSDPAAAKRLLDRLGELLHSVFDRLDAELVPLPREIEILRAYLDIERARFGSRLEVTIEVDEAAAAVQVPPLILQPIVENAVKHGVAPHARPGRVRVSARRHGGELRLRVSDSGNGAADVDRGSEGQGLELTRRRLEATYPEAHRIVFEHGEDGFAVELRLPAVPAGHA